MAIKTFTIADFTQQSSWTVEYMAGSNILVSGPSQATTTKTVSFFTIPTGSIINSATLTATVGSTNYTLRTLDDVFFSGSRNVKSKVTAGGSASFVFKFKGSGSTSSPGSFTAGLQYTNVKVTVDYSLPESGLTLNLSTCKAGDTIRATITPASTAYSHKVKFAMTGVTTVTSPTIPAGTKIYDYQVPLDWQNAFGNYASRTVTVTLETYNGGTKIGEVSKTFTLTLSDDAYPTITSFTITRIPGFTDEAILGYVQGFSQAQIESAADGAYSSTISEYKVTIGAWSNIGADVTTPILMESGTMLATLEVTDNRGRKATYTESIEVIPYAAPALNNPLVNRSNDLGVAAPLGTYLCIKTGFAISTLGGTPDVNAATLSVRFYQKGTTPPAWGDASVVALTAGADNIISGLSISYSYSVDIRIVDKLGSYTYSAVIPSSSVAFSLKAGGLGAAFGKFAELDNALEIAWANGWLGGNPIATYRVGNLFFTFEEESPADLYPGTVWEKLAAGKFLIAGDAAGSFIPDDTTYGSGGEAAHTLTTAEMPSHTHGLKFNPSGTADQWGLVGAVKLSAVVNYRNSYQEATGGGGAHNNMPPWIAVYIWRRTA